MVEFQPCAADFDEPCVPLPKLPVLPLPHDSSGYQHSSQDIAGKVGGGGTEEEEEERGASLSSFDNVRATGGGASAARPSLKRARLEDDDDLSISPMDLSEPNDSALPFIHHHQPLYHHHHHQAVETTNNFATLPSQQQQHVLPDQNGHATPSGSLEPHFGSEAAHLISESDDHHDAGGLLYPPMSGQAAAYFQGGVNVADVLAELERERIKNIELQDRLRSLEARLDSNGKDGPSVQNGTKKIKKQRRVEKTPENGEVEDARKLPDEPIQVPAIKDVEDVVLQVAVPLEALKPTHGQDTGVTWMSRDEVTAADLEKLNKDSVSERDDSLDSDDDDDDDEEDDDEFEDDEDGEGRAKMKRTSEGDQVWKSTGMTSEASRGGILGGKGEAFFLGGPGEGDQEEDESEGVGKKIRRRKRKKGKKGKHGEKLFSKKRSFGNDMMSFRGSGIVATYKKAPKTAFCPNEVKRIMESGVLALRNAQSHTMRKIIVFASLGIRHGCEDLYELDFSHFSIVRRGEPHKSPKDPGEHVLYDQPGGRKKIFYPNRQNPILCPVRILDEEMAMRPVGPSCPTCLFLCIKYGGRTRNLPQNEYVRQRMGRNKLKSFGPLMCQMALLVHIRTGSFFFKALGITLLFMAGFPDDLVRKETKYRNLDLLQKYYRSDEDAKGEQLFHPYPTFFPQTMMVAPPPVNKTAVGAKAIGKKGPPPLISKPPSSMAAGRYLQPLSARSPSTMPFRGLPPFSPPLPPIPTSIPTSTTASGNPSPPGPPPPSLPPFGMYPPYPPPPIQGPPGGFAPMPWAPVNSYPPGPYPPPPFGYSFSHSSQFMPPYYGPPYRFPPYGQQPSVKESKKDTDESGRSDSDADSGSSGSGQQCEEKGEDREVQ